MPVGHISIIKVVNIKLHRYTSKKLQILSHSVIYDFVDSFSIQSVTDIRVLTHA